MKITTKKIIRELKKKGWDINYTESLIVTDVRDIINEILKQHKNISINGKS